MGERAQKIVVRGASVQLYFTRWGGQACAEALLQGASGLAEDLQNSEPMEQMWDPDFAEGGYLVDFDHECILLYSWDKPFIERVQSDIESRWPGWAVRSVPDGVPDFRAYLSALGLASGEPAA